MFPSACSECCIFHKPRAFDESSSDEEGGDEERRKRSKSEHPNGDHKCNHDHQTDGQASQDPSMSESRPKDDDNSYENKKWFEWFYLLGIRICITYDCDLWLKSMANSKYYEEGVKIGRCDKRGLPTRQWRHRPDGLVRDELSNWTMTHIEGDAWFKCSWV